MNTQSRSRFGFLLSLCGLLNTACTAQVVLTSEPVVSAVTHSSARIFWMTDVNSTTVIRWDTDGPDYDNVTTGSPQTSNTRTHSWFLSGLKPQTTYHFSVCSAIPGGTEQCSSDATFTTAERGDPGPLPPAEVELDMPAASGNTLTVGSDCDHPSTGLVARWQQAQWGDTVVIPVSVVCAGHYVFPAKTADTQVPHRWIVTRSDAAGQLPAAGIRLDPASDGGKLARLEANRPTTLRTSLSALPVACEAGAYAWASDDPRPFKLHQCRNGTPRAITNLVSGAPGTPFTVTVPNHGLTGTPYVRVSGVQGNTNANGTFGATVLDANTLQLAYLGWKAWTGSGVYEGGGQISANVWQPVAYTSGATVPASCDSGWFLRTGGPADENSYRCLENGKFKRLSLAGSFTTQDGSAIDLSTNQAHHLRFIGLEVTTVRLPEEPLWLQLSRDPFRGQPGSVFLGLIHQSYRNHHIVWDRCWIHGQPDRTRTWIGLNFDGAHVAVLDSMLDGFVIWGGVEPGTFNSESQSTALYIPVGPGPLRVENNFIGAVGISLYVPSDWCCALPAEPSDAIIRRNTFFADDKYRFGSPTFSGQQGFMRHLLELKQGQRWKIEGNVFDGTFTSINQAAAIALTPRVDQGFFTIGQINSGTVTMSATFGRCPESLEAGDWVSITGSTNPSLNTGWQVAAVSPDRCSLELAGLSGSANGGFLQPMNNSKTVADIDVRHNTFQNVANGMFIIGHTDGANNPGVQLETARRIRIENNLFRSIDGTRANKFDTSYFPNGVGGYPLYASLGMEDLTVVHNTFASSEPGPGFALEYQNACAPTRTCNPHAGLTYENNLVIYGTGGGVGAIAASGTAFGQAALDALWRFGDTPGWIYRNNVIAHRGALPTQPPFGPYPAQNKLHDLNQGPVPYANPTNGDFQLTARYRRTDSCYGSPGDCTTTGLDVGVDMERLLAAQGRNEPRTASLKAGSRQALLAASARQPDTCSAEAVASSGAVTAASVLGAGRSVQFWFDQLTPGQTYQFRARCASGTFETGSFSTRPVGPPRRFALRLAPPASLDVEQAELWTGSDPGSLASAQVLPCASRCGFSIEVPDGSPFFYRVVYRRPGGQPVTGGPVQAWVP